MIRTRSRRHVASPGPKREAVVLAMDHLLERPTGMPSRLSGTTQRQFGLTENQNRYSDDYSPVKRSEALLGPAQIHLVGPKACAQCGTTRTPQWREGPEGPKTLCNACGVKRVRQMRSNSDSSKRRSTKSPAVLVKQSSSDTPNTDDYYEAKEIVPKRPLRKAAIKSAAKTADLAVKADWKTEHDEDSFHSSQDTGSAESAGHNSDSAEEVAWVPERHANPCHLPPSPMEGTVGPECAAAVNLLSMIHDQNFSYRFPSQIGSHRTTSGDMAPEERETHPMSAGHAFTVPSRKWDGQQAVSADPSSEICNALSLFPEAQRSDIIVAKEDFDSTSRESAAADAAVAAVAKILAQKQAAAITARAHAQLAANRLETLVETLGKEYGWNLHQGSHKRHRTH